LRAIAHGHIVRPLVPQRFSRSDFFRESRCLISSLYCMPSENRYQRGIVRSRQISLVSNLSSLPLNHLDLQSKRRDSRRAYTRSRAAGHSAMSLSAASGPL
jgi:hypothetical protein